MASGIFVLLDDIAALMDDVASMSKIATKKTAGILGDDLAVNAEKASGFVSSREIPVLWQITKGSFLNKLIILPLAFILSAFVPVAITVILLIGAIYLAFEGAEKVYEYFVPHEQTKTKANLSENLSKEEILVREKDKIKSAIVTDFILSVEIIIIALGTVVSIEQPLLTQILSVSVVAIIATIGVYGIVALIVRMDDLGYRFIKLSNGKKNFTYQIGNLLVNALPKVIKGLAFIGTIALFLVAGGIFVHKIHFIHELVKPLPSIVGEFLSGLVIGFIALGIYKAGKKIFIKK
ncbi:DUF808 domain-containing protein [Tenacibaculum sp. IB213877]|uniref:DUF808 domain-containing protein n=1 Tax=Tenacibaculum sp. IB213877 TaxID=3097351 RepID=UPI002A598D4C|nr:DUF808 domain-containing protein [Tenacibaculum sp. IB213877]MDY0779416.1 DUF808 domain-containing protein [Tenacibaculum sp. IB213877]